MGAFDRDFEPDKPSGTPDKPTDTPTAEGDRRAARRDAPVETRSPGEYFADLQQAAGSGWDRKLRFDAPRDELAGFKPEDAGLPEVSIEEADRYVEQHLGDRPWLQEATDASPEARRIIVAADLAGAHGHIRHDGWVNEEANMLRVTRLEDPAHTDPDDRRRGIDGLNPDDGPHKCGKYATRITDPDAYATAYKRGSEHPNVQDAINGLLEPGDYPVAVEIPIADLLGPDGHRFCTGWELDPGEGSMRKARDSRLNWQEAMSKDQPPPGPAPAARPVRTFEGGKVTFIIDKNEGSGRYMIDTVSVQPPEKPKRRS